MRITLFGYGNTNRAVAKRYASRCDIFDDKFRENGIDEFGNALFQTHLFCPEASKIEIVTPGIPPYHPLVSLAQNLVSDYDFFASSSPYSIWISGTNGKTTTTQMCHTLLKKYGALAGGNIGEAVASLDSSAKMWILECSSFTLHYTNIAKPNIYLLLPITQDHISWHGSFREYELSKLKPLKSLKEGEVAIIPKKYESVESKGFKICYEDSKHLARYFGIDTKKIAHKEPFLLDALLALATTKMLFDEVDYELLNSFKIGEHRICEFFDRYNRIWVDDSKGTNVDATIEAIKRYKEVEMLFLILGGDDKGASLDKLFFSLKGINIHIFAIGSNSSKIYEYARASNIPCLLSYELKDAIDSISKLHNNKSIALLSPAAASLDQFSSYKQRGELFREYVLEL